MAANNYSRRPLNIGFISFRFAGTDGVSLETSKWAHVLEEMGHTCFYFSGLSDRPAERSIVVPEAHFRDAEVLEHYDHFFGAMKRSAEDTRWVHDRREFFRGHVERFIKEFELDLLIPQNLFSYPLNIPLSLALTEIIAETNIPTIAHHHDFTWERQVFLVNSVWDYINASIPPSLPAIQHVVINSAAQHQLARRKGVGSTIIPNVMDYENPPPEEPDEYASDVRETLGLDPDELLILQPTRIVQRKGIEHAIELVSRLKLKASLVISHAAGDDGYSYEKRVKDYAKLLNVRVRFAAEIFDENRGTTKDGRKIYSLADVYPHADLVTYPSVVEGFGNAFLEALYYRKPIVVNNYSIYAIDIRPKGFRVIEFDDFITDETVERTRELLNNPKLVAEMCDHNYRLAVNHFSYMVLRHKLQIELDNAFGTNGN
ncbi:MAG: glycosyltransferase family 4 protein [Chloroflexi bacterium]|nr:glycosyltransferase family 4 protein [Chloroflexota bacterium]